MSFVRFEKSPAGRLVRATLDHTPYRAFVPHPLPPKIEFDAELTLALSDADRAIGELAGLGRMLLDPHLLIGPFVRREAVLSSRIEGTQASIVDLYALESGQFAIPGMAPIPADAREVASYVAALEYGLERVKTLPVSQRLITELHAVLMEGARGGRVRPGAYRREQSWIGVEGCTVAEASYVPPPVPEMMEALDAWENYVHADDVLPPLVRLAALHYQFEAIHPFLDGNGRIGRLLISLLLVEWELLPFPLLYLSAFFERNRDAYLDLLLAVSERGAWREWTLFFLHGVTEQARDAVQRARRLQDLQRDWRGRLLDIRTSARLLQLADSLFLAPIVTVPRAAQLLGVTYRAAQQNVQRLVDARVLQPVGAAEYRRAYVAGEILSIAGGVPVP